MEVHRD